MKIKYLKESKNEPLLTKLESLEEKLKSIKKSLKEYSEKPSSPTYLSDALEDFHSTVSTPEYVLYRLSKDMGWEVYEKENTLEMLADDFYTEHYDEMEKVVVSNVNEEIEKWDRRYRISELMNGADADDILRLEFMNVGFEDIQEFIDLYDHIKP